MIGTFFIAEFIFTMQFLWKYIDDLVGKGLEFSVVIKLIGMFAVTMLPLALPLSLLLASCMALGNLGENNELIALKSGGVSLLKTLRVPLIFVGMICIGSFFINNNVIPYINLKYYSLLFDIRKHKPALDIRENIFYRGISGYTLKVGSKSSDNTTIFDIILYDHSSGRGNDNVLLADKGELYLSPDEKYLILNVYNGVQYQDMSQRKEFSFYPKEQTATYFDKLHKVFDLTEFKLTRTDQALFKGNYQMMNTRQMRQEMDSISRSFALEHKDIYNFGSSYLGIKKNPNTFIDSSLLSGPLHVEAYQSILSKPEISATLKKKIKDDIMTLQSNMDANLEQRKNKLTDIAEYKTEYYKKFNLSLSCMILFLIGCSMGAIIRKGGFGMPILISVIYYMLFHVLNMGGDKLSTYEMLPPLLGAWLSSIVLMPIALYIFWKANSDTKIFINEFKVTLPKWLSQLSPS
jgi:lipopolysaccharide export system permease protein